MIKKLVLVFVALIAIQSYGQEGTASPYSFYGIGSLKFKGTVENRSMGGIGVFIDSIHVNLRNPASYVTKNIEAWDNQSRPVKFAVGGSYTSTNLKAEDGSDTSKSTTFDYIAINIPAGKFGFGLGLLPYTSVGYKLESLNDANDLENRFTGEGGLNKAFLGMAYQITDGLSFGVDAQYNFGNIRNSIVEYVYDNGVITQYQSRETNRSDLSGLNFNFGLSYNRMLTNKLQLAATATYTPESELVSKNERSIATIITNSSTGQEIVNNSIDVDLEGLGLEETELTLPSKLSFGLGIGQPRKWFAGAEYTTQKTSNFSNDLFSSNTTSYEDASTISVGGFFIPDYRSLTNYLKRSVYRAGVRYEKTGLVINTESIKEFGISFGVGLPLSGGISNANFGVEIGKRGTTNNNLIQENFINFQLSLSLGDRWFQKRKYN
ncbi:hypothetical protein [Seonamhaeicola marinus]|uniref:Outer membrane beta-barrel protein n=1 Tax=Seonamhaeicola marinus TaxID=1912246 RepID=A0A5D0J9W7_9FLAO|nr:hypothetical protein [Seonamhaeicola marinus]TYA92359.1 hypothetical protein FUA24_02685 [Seonamhaeicola marinus]